MRGTIAPFMNAHKRGIEGMEQLPRITGEQVVLRPITDADTDHIVVWRNTPSVMQSFIFRQ